VTDTLAYYDFSYSALPFDKCLALPLHTLLKELAREKRSSLFITSINDKEKKGFIQLINETASFLSVIDYRGRNFKSIIIDHSS
jgi:hypothetical protein